MYIKSITLEGFKSYGQRTNIDGFDPFFNAITGLNGSGKSNILDGICFLLGITNLSQVRAANLQELVYKNGQAGISKASVSITFDNTDKNQTPVGYGEYTEITVTRQVVIGGRNKYLINGCNAQNTRVQDLFRSVQMNVNNPHFLIMQGRVTKVLNMKPPEILSMIEEAAGTKMYETKKQDAQRKIENKDTKLREIKTILDEDIMPTLDKLRHERETYLEYQKIERELEYITKLCVAHQYITEEELSKTSKTDLEKRVTKIQELKEKYVEATAELKEMDNMIITLENQRTTESGNALHKLQSALIAVEKEEAKISSNFTSKQGSLDAEKLKAADLQKQKNEDETAVNNKATDLEGMMTVLEKIREESTKDAEMAATARARFQAASSGLSTNDQGQAATLAEQLMSAKNEVSAAETESKQAELKLRHSEPDVEKKETELKKTENEYKKDVAAMKPLEDAVTKIEANLGEMGYDENVHQMLLETHRGLQREATAVREKLEMAESRFPQTSFEYSDPQPNFDRSKVKGLVCTLFKVKDPQYATALEVIAGGKLYNVIVDNETTGKLLLERGNLRKRHTIIPLNKIEGRPITQDVLHRAQQLVGGDNVCTALSLVDYDRSLQSAMEYVFGNTLVCSNMDTAKKVTYDRAVHKRTVTLEGELFDPAGTLSGGSRKPGAPVLLQLTDLMTMKQQLKDKLNELKRAENNLAQVTALSNRFKELRQQLELKQREVNLVTQRLKNTTHHKQLEEVKLLKQNIDEQHEVLRTCSERMKKAEKRVADLEDKLQNVNLYRERELKEAEQNAAQCQKQAEISNKRMKEKQQEVEVLKMEAEELKNGLLHYDEQLEVVNKAIADYEKEKADLEDELNRLKEEVENAKESVKQQKVLLRSTDDEIAEMHRKQDTLQRETEGTKLKTKELQLELTKMETTTKEAAQRLKALETKFQWIAAERKYFGQPNSVYDFQANDPIEAKRRLNKLHASKEKLSKNVNMRAMTLLGETEKQFNDLIKKKAIVENDKKKIAAAIQELDEKKKETLHAAWEQVNKDFGSIFTSLLPGTQAKLLPPEGKTVLDGLEFKVAFGNKWKESLNELSGGQRSLVALSLILAMLRFKAAPIYILDEVDAALDLSHTQNIGSMLRTHFKNSQFIIVSLKDGMFNNANVLFKTKFVDGMSTVSRHTPTISRGGGGSGHTISH